MTREEAIAWFNEITDGAGAGWRNDVLDVLPRGELAKKKWNDSLFTYGVEYGALIAIIKIFNLTKDDLIS